MTESKKEHKDLNYWLRQVRLTEKSRAVDSEQKIRRIYKNLLSDLNGFLGNEYAAYSDKDGRLTVSILQEKSRYARFLEEVTKKVDNIAPDVSKTIIKTVENTYSNCYKGMVEAVKDAKDTKTLSNLLKDINVKPEVMKRAIDNPISGLTLPDRLQKNRQEVIYNVKQQINIGLMNGDRYDTVAKKLEDQLNISYGKATNIVRTETHRVQEGGFNDCAKEIAESIEDSDMVYTSTWRTMKDSRVRPNQRQRTSKGRKTRKKNRRSKRNLADHQKMEGVTIRVGDKFDLGSGIYTDCPGNSGDAGNDCRCRCFLEYNLMTYGEYEEITGKKIYTKSDKSDKVKSNVTFTPTETIEEAENYVREVIGIPNCSYKGVDIVTANAWNEGLTDSFSKFPELKNNFGFVGECHERNKAMKQIMKEYFLTELIKINPQYTAKELEPYADKEVRKVMNKMKVSTKTYAESWSPTAELFKGFRGVCVNKIFGKDSNSFVNSLKRDVENKHTPVGCDTIKSVFDHEIGHQLDNLLGISELPKVQKLFDSHTKEELTELLSEYSWNNDNPSKYSEMIAEAWSEYCNNPKPRKIAKTIGEVIQNTYNMKFKK